MNSARKLKAVHFLPLRNPPIDGALEATKRLLCGHRLPGSSVAGPPALGVYLANQFQSDAIDGHFSLSAGFLVRGPG
jgi:hypothetical protein